MKLVMCYEWFGVAVVGLLYEFFEFQHFVVNLGFIS
jgi:hypothetical protein